MAKAKKKKAAPKTPAKVVRYTGSDKIPMNVIQPKGEK